MHSRITTTIQWLLAGLCLGPGLTFAADLLLTNARVYTVNLEQPWAEAVAIEAGRVVFVGDNDAVLAMADDSTRVVELGGRMLLPGFQDAHAHLGSSGIAYFITCSVFELPDLDAVLARIAQCVAADPEAGIIRGEGWTMDQFKDGLPPRKELLDAIDATRPLVFDDGDGHALWLNSKAFETYGITADTPDPPGGRIQRDPETGALWGTLHEDSAMNLVKSQWPPFSDAELADGIRQAQALFLSLGITAIQEALVRLNSRDAYRSLPAFVALRDSGELKLRTSLSLAWNPAIGIGPQLAAFKQARERHSGGRLRVNTIKFWADGVVETHTARLLEPYTDQPDTLGLMMIPRATLLAAAPPAEAAGFQLHYHAIGDGAVRYALDAVAAARAANGAAERRHHINHVQFVHPDDIPRFAALGVSASFEPYWAYEDDYITYLTRPRVGPERIQWTYPIATILRSGARIAFSSDWAVSSANPLLGIETAITRTDPHSNQGEPFLPEERIGLGEAIAAYTIDSAWLNFLDGETGSIEAGKYADLVVLDRDLFAIPATGISDAEVQATLIEGEVVYGTLE